MRIVNGRGIEFDLQLRGEGGTAVVEFYRMGSRSPLTVRRAQDFLREHADFAQGAAHLSVGPTLHVEYLEPAQVGKVVDWLRARLETGEPLPAEDLAPERVSLELARLHWCQGNPEPYLGGCVSARLHFQILRDGEEEFTGYLVNAGAGFDGVATERYRVAFARLRGVADYERDEVRLHGQARTGLRVDVLETPSVFSDPWREDPSWQPYTVYLLPTTLRVRVKRAAAPAGSQGWSETRSESWTGVQAEMGGVAGEVVHE